MNLEGTPTPFFDVYQFFSILNFRSRRSRNVASSIALTPVKGFAMSLMRGTKGNLSLGTVAKLLEKVYWRLGVISIPF
jgi:hypothetical protein